MAWIFAGNLSFFLACCLLPVACCLLPIYYTRPMLPDMILDVDHFKQFNDTYGHDVGDIVLQKVAQFLQKQVRKYDIVCRYGGE
ncbi:MAG: GGDEF domain-containing protein [Okeania sp. SIO2C9]|nr:GGDEF domain-containing protein [Okeania sp. SIO2C9]